MVKVHHHLRGQNCLIHLDLWKVSRLVMPEYKGGLRFYLKLLLERFL